MAKDLHYKELKPAEVSGAEWLALNEAIDLMPGQSGSLKPYFKNAIKLLQKQRNRHDIRRVFGEEKGYDSRLTRFNEFLKRNGFPFTLSRFVMCRGLYDAGLIRNEA